MPLLLVEIHVVTERFLLYCAELSDALLHVLDAVSHELLDLLHVEVSQEAVVPLVPISDPLVRDLPEHTVGLELSLQLR